MCFIPTMCSEEFDFFKALQQVVTGCTIRLTRCEDLVIRDDELHLHAKDYVAQDLVPQDLVSQDCVPQECVPQEHHNDDSHAEECKIFKTTLHKTTLNKDALRRKESQGRTLPKYGTDESQSSVCVEASPPIQSEIPSFLSHKSSTFKKAQSLPPKALNQTSTSQRLDQALKQASKKHTLTENKLSKLDKKEPSSVFKQPSEEHIATESKSSRLDQALEVINKKPATLLKQLYHQRLEDELKNRRSVIQSTKETVEISAAPRSSASDVQNPSSVPLGGTFDVEGTGITIQWCQTKPRPRIYLKKPSDLLPPSNVHIDPLEIISRNISFLLIRFTNISQFLWHTSSQVPDNEINPVLPLKDATPAERPIKIIKMQRNRALINETQANTPEAPTNNTVLTNSDDIGNLSVGITLTQTNTTQKKTLVRDMPPKKRQIDSTLSKPNKVKKVRKEKSLNTWSKAIDFLHALKDGSSKSVDKLRSDIIKECTHELHVEKLLCEIIEKAIQHCDDSNLLDDLKILISKTMDESVAAKFGINSWTAKIVAIFEKHRKPLTNSEIQSPFPYASTQERPVKPYTAATNSKALEIQLASYSNSRQQLVQQQNLNQMLPTPPGILQPMNYQPYSSQYQQQQSYPRQLPQLQPPPPYESQQAYTPCVRQIPHSKLQQNIPLSHQSQQLQQQWLQQQKWLQQQQRHLQQQQPLQQQQHLQQQQPLQQQQHFQQQQPLQQQQHLQQQQQWFKPQQQEMEQMRIQKQKMQQIQQPQSLSNLHRMQQLQYSSAAQQLSVTQPQHQPQSQQQHLQYGRQSVAQFPQQAQQQWHQNRQQSYPQQPFLSQTARSMCSDKEYNPEVSRFDNSPPIANTAPPSYPPICTMMTAVSENSTGNTQQVFVGVSYQHSTKNISSQPNGAKHAQQHTRNMNFEIGYNKCPLQDDARYTELIKQLLESSNDNNHNDTNNNNNDSVNAYMYNGADLPDILNNIS